MADRENVKIVISAALIVIVASMGIYAFIYRDKISEMLPNWQGKGKTSERMIFDAEKEGSDSSSSSLATAEEDKDLPSYKVDTEAKEYPEIPNLPKKESQEQASAESAADKESNPPATMRKSSDSGNSSLASLKENPIPPEISDKASTVYKANPVEESKTKIEPSKVIEKKNTQSTNPPKLQTNTKPTLSSSNISSKPKTYNLSTSKPKTQNLSKQKTISKPKTNPKSSIKTNQQKSSSSSIATKQPSSKSSSTEERIKRLETKLNVHMQDTNTRIESIERRVERLEKKLLEAQ